MHTPKAEGGIRKFFLVFLIGKVILDLVLE